MKRKFRIIVGMLLLAIPLCMNAQVKVKKPGQDSNEAKEQKTEQEKTEKPKDGLTMPKISGFVQGMYQANLSDKGDLLDNTLRMRRVRLSVDGKLSNTVSLQRIRHPSRSIQDPVHLGKPHQPRQPRNLRLWRECTKACRLQRRLRRRCPRS